LSSYAAPWWLPGGHLQTIYGWANPRYFPRLTAPMVRYFDVDRDARVLAHCHWQERPWNHATNRLSVADPASLAANEVTLTLSCIGRAGASCPGTGTAGSELHLLAARFTMLDALSPSITAVSGSLTTGGDKAGTQTLRFSATDAGAGIYRTFLDVDGTTVATSTPNTNTGHCADAVPANSDPCEFQHAQPCPLAVTDVDVPFDTRTVADGTHTVQLRVEDAAGNETSAYGPATMVVRNTPTPVTPTPVTPNILRACRSSRPAIRPGR